MLNKMLPAGKAYLPACRPQNPVLSEDALFAYRTFSAAAAAHLSRLIENDGVLAERSEYPIEIQLKESVDDAAAEAVRRSFRDHGWSRLERAADMLGLPRPAGVPHSKFLALTVFQLYDDIQFAPESAVVEYVLPEAYGLLRSPVVGNRYDDQWYRTVDLKQLLPDKQRDTSPFAMDGVVQFVTHNVTVLVYVG